MDNRPDAARLFYATCAALLGLDDLWRAPVPRRTRWNNRDAGNGRFPPYGTVRRFSSAAIQVNLTAPVKAQFTARSEQEVYDFLTGLALAKPIEVAPAPAILPVDAPAVDPAARLADALERALADAQGPLDRAALLDIARGALAPAPTPDFKLVETMAEIGVDLVSASEKPGLWWWHAANESANRPFTSPEHAAEQALETLQLGSDFAVSLARVTPSTTVVVSRALNPEHAAHMALHIARTNPYIHWRAADEATPQVVVGALQPL